MISLYVSISLLLAYSGVWEVGARPPLTDAAAASLRCGRHTHFRYGGRRGRCRGVNEGAKMCASRFDCNESLKGPPAAGGHDDDGDDVPHRPRAPTARAPPARGQFTATRVRTAHHCRLHRPRRARTHARESCAVRLSFSSTQLLTATALAAPRPDVASRERNATMRPASPQHGPSPAEISALYGAQTVRGGGVQMRAALPPPPAAAPVQQRGSNTRVSWRFQRPPAGYAVGR